MHKSDDEQKQKSIFISQHPTQNAWEPRYGEFEMFQSLTLREMFPPASRGGRSTLKQSRHQTTTHPIKQLKIEIFAENCNRNGSEQK